MRNYYGKMQLFTVFRNTELMKSGGSKPYFGEIHILTIFRYNKTCDIDTTVG